MKASHADKAEQSTLHNERTNIIANHLTHLRARPARLMYSRARAWAPVSNNGAISIWIHPPPPFIPHVQTDWSRSQPVSQWVSQSARRLCKWKSGPRWRWESFYLVDTHYKGEFQTSEMEALRSIMVSALSARNEIYTFEEHFTRGMG